MRSSRSGTISWGRLLELQINEIVKGHPVDCTHYNLALCILAFNKMETP